MNNREDKMTQIPKKIKIAGHIFSVIYPFEFEPELNQCGKLCNTENKIFIAGSNEGKKYAQSQVWAILIHEIIHQIGKISQTTELWENEETVERIASAVLDILISNEWLKV